jgi:ABC-2 type transport system permease protein
VINPTIAGFVRKELSQALRDPRMRGMLLIMPVVQLLMFGYALSSETRNIRLAVAAAPSDALTREFRDRLLGGGWFVPVSPGAGDPFDWVRSGRAEAVLVAPSGGGDKAIGRGNAEYQLLIDATNAERARSVERYAKSVLGALLRSRGDPGSVAVAMSVRTLYNPEDDTSTYMVPGTLCLLLCLVTLSLTSMSMTRELEMGTLETLLAAPVSPWEVLAGKTVPFALLGMADVPLVLSVAWAMGVPIRAPLWEIFLVSGVFVSTSVALGFLISSYTKSAQQAQLGTFLLLFPAIQLSGVVYPVENMPTVVRWITYLDPIRYLVIMIRHLMLKGGDLGLLLPNLAALAAIGAVAVVWAGRRFRQTLN